MGQETGCEMITLAEYARRNHYCYSTVAEWAKKGKLTGVVKEPLTRGGFVGYRYMVPAEVKAEGTKKSAEQLARIIYQETGEKLLSAKEYAEQMGCGRKTVLNWCAQGNMPDARKVEREGGGYAYLIPENARPIKCHESKMGHRRKAEKEQEAARPARKRTEREISQYIRRHCGTRTYRQLSEELGLSTMEIRARYDRLHERDGI